MNANLINFEIRNRNTIFAFPTLTKSKKTDEKKTEYSFVLYTSNREKERVSERGKKMQ